MNYRRHAARLWRTNPKQLRLARTPGGSKVHRPDCIVITSTTRIADALLAGRTEAEAEAGGNITHPIWIASGEPTCKICR